MFSTISKGVAAAALVIAAAACSTPASGSAAAPTSAAAAAASTSAAEAAPGADDRPAVEKTFTDYNAALVARDFTTACSLTSPDASAALIKALAAQGAQVSTCEDAFKAVYAVPEAAGPLDEAAKSSKIDDVTIAGDVATVTYSGSASGQMKTGLTNKMQRFDGQWKLLGNDS